MEKRVNLLWDEWNKEHIKKHEVTVEEVEEAYKEKEIVFQSYLGRKVIIGRTRQGRLLTIIISFAKQRNSYVVSARDASKKERRLYNEKTKTDKTV